VTPLPLLVSAIFMTVAADAAPQPSQTAPRPRAGRCWRLVAASDAIVHGRIISVAPAPSPPATNLILAVDRWLKGKEEAGQLSARDREGATTSAGRSVIAFLRSCDTRAPYCLVESGADVCRPAWENSEVPSDLVEEIERQGQLKAALPEIVAQTRQTRLFKAVQRDVEALVRANSKTKAERVRRLIGRGPEAVPALIVLMDDDRDVARGLIEVPVTAPNGFEGVGHYNPTTVFAVLNLVLPQLTRISFGMDEGEEANQKRILAAWRMCLAYGCPPPLLSPASN
jgi:hypothetical protein